MRERCGERDVSVTLGSSVDEGRTGGRGERESFFDGRVDFETLADVPRRAKSAVAR